MKKIPCTLHCLRGLNSGMDWFFPRALEGSTITTTPLSDSDVTSQLDGQWKQLRVEIHCWRFVLIAPVGIFGHYADIIRRFRSPPFHSTITPQCGDPAKMKWMFKEDHSLGKGVWVVMKQEMFLSCHAPSFQFCFLRVDFCYIILHVGAELHACHSIQQMTDVNP